MPILKTHTNNNARIFIPGKGLMNYSRLIPYLKESEGPIIWMDDNSFRCTVRAMIKADQGFTIDQLHACVRSGGVLERVKELEC